MLLKQEQVMMNFNISLPETIKQLIDSLVASGMFKNPGNYIRILIERDQLKRERKNIEAALIKGLDSGPSTPLTIQDWEEIEREGVERLAARNVQ